MRIGDTQQPLIKALGRALASETAFSDPSQRVRIVYVTSGSCTNVDAVYSGTPITENLFYLPTPEEDPDFDPSAQPSPTCRNDYGPGGVPGASIDVGISATFVSSCQVPSTLLDIRVFSGPVQAYLWVVPEPSTHKALTMEEGYFAFGFGNDSALSSWNDETAMHIRPQTKSSILTPAAAIGVPASRWRGVRWDKSTQVLSAVVADGAVLPQHSIGILGAQIYDRNRPQINALAFRGKGQWYAYYPDSTPNARDKKNVRDGHYLPWSPIEMMIPYDPATGQPLNHDALTIVNMLIDAPVALPLRFAPIDYVIAAGMVPRCAMQVTRRFEGGDLEPAPAEQPCSCYYEAQVGSLGADCVPCDPVTRPCTSGVCRLGYCEAR
ncbi:MAG: hypothetical protein ACPGUV_08155 [Polyangiales bacterium]